MYLTNDEWEELRTHSKNEGSYQRVVEILQRKMSDAQKLVDTNAQLYQHVVEHSDNLVFRQDLEGQLLYVNPSLEQVLGTPSETLIGHHIDTLGIDDEMIAAFGEVRQHINEIGKVTTLEFSVSRNGRNYIYDTLIIPEFDLVGKVVSVLAIARDISEQKRTEDDLKRYKEWLRKAHEVGGIGSWEANLETGATYWSDEFYRICGLEPQSVEPSRELGFSIIHPDDRARAGEAVTQSQNEGVSYIIEKRIIRPSGEVRWVESRGEFVFDEATQTDKLIGTFLDITERKTAELALKQSEARYRSILSAMTEGVILQDDSGGMLMCNDATIEILGMSREALFGRFGKPQKWELLGEDGEAFPREQFPARITLDTGKPQYNVIMGIQHSIKNELRWLNINTHPLKSDDEAFPHGIVMTISDVTEERMADEARLRAQLERERANILARFIQMASHEFRTPLSIIATNAYLLPRLHDSEKQKKKIQQINEQVKRLNYLIDVQLLMTKFDSGTAMQSMSVSLKKLLSNVISKCRNKVESKNLTIHEPEIIPSDLSIVADYDYLQQAVDQLVDNAIRYSHDGGTISLRAHQTETQVIIAIEDVGIGIEADDMPLIFERFWRKDTAHREAGFGLGLSLAQKIIALHDGLIECESQFGKGSTFRIVLPI